jgi:hypothetical protein
MAAASKRLRKWHKSSNDIVSKYLDEKRPTIGPSQFRLNLLNSNVKTILSMLYGHLPRPDVSRIDQTGNDDIARVAAETMERLLRLDIDENTQSYDATLYSVLLDRLLGGLGTARVRYEMEETQIELDEAALQPGMPPLLPPTPQTQLYESAPIDYVYWEDILWGWGRNFSELPWIAFRSYMSKDEITERFGEEVAQRLQYKQQQVASEEGGMDDPDLNSAWQKAEVWEIWCKTEETVYWYSPGASKILDSEPDPLGLSGFFPCPPFLLANPTTSLYIPTPDYHLAQDLYNQIDALQTRIAILTDAVKVVGVYDQSSEGVKRMLSEGVENDLIPVDNWAMFAEKGGLRGQVDWLPIEAVVNALEKLRQLRDETIGLLQQVTGMADIMRGDLGNAYEGVGQTQIKARFGSARLQALQEQFAQFVADLFQIKAEIIAKHFEPETILKQSSMQFSPDVQVLPQAIQLMKSPEFRMRVAVRPETMAQMDYAEMQAERSNYLKGLSGFLQAAAPMVEMDQRSLPFLLTMLKWAMAAFKGSKEIEGVMDQAIATMEQQPPEDPEANKPSPEEIRGQIQVQLEQIRQQAKQQEIQMQHQAELAMRAADEQADIRTKQAESAMRMREKEFETMAEMEILGAKLEADVQTELMTSRINAEQNNAAVQGEIQKELIKARTEVMKTELKQKGDQQLKIIEKQIDAMMKREELDERLIEKKLDIQNQPTQGPSDEEKV